MLKAYRYKLEPNKSQRDALARTLDICRELYNECLSCGHQDNADHNATVNILARNEPLDANVSAVTLCVV